MTTRKRKQLIREGEYVAEVEIDVMDSPDDPWGPYLSLREMEKLDRVRECLRRGDLQTVAHQARLYRLTPVSAA